MRPKKGQLECFRPTNLKRGQIFEIWPERGQPDNPIPGISTLRVRHTPNQTDSDVTFPDRAIKGNHKNALKDNYEHLTDFLSQISKLSYFNLLELADFLMHH